MGKDKKKNKKKFVLTVIRQSMSSNGGFDDLRIMEMQQFKEYGDAFTAMYLRAEELYDDKVYIADYPDAADIVLENERGSWIGRLDLADDFGCMELYTLKGRYVITFHEVGFRNEAEYEIAVS